MTWDTDSVILGQFRAQHILCPTIISRGWNTNPFYHNSSASITGSLVDTLPFFILNAPTESRDRYAEGATALINGSLVSTLYADIVTCPSIANIESLARAIMKDMASQFSGLAFSRFDVGLCSDLNPGQRAETQNPNEGQAAFRTITTIYHFGLNR